MTMRKPVTDLRRSQTKRSNRGNRGPAPFRDRRDVAPAFGRHPSAFLIAILLGADLALCGCSTPGPVHLYSIAPNASEIHDAGIEVSDSAHSVPSFLEPDDRLTGFAYDPFTDHFFLRLTPGNHIRVVDRPARKIKHEFVIDGIAPESGGDLAVSPRDGHLYLVDPSGPAIDEATRLGKLIGRIALQGRSAPAAAIAFDPAQNRLIVLSGDGITVERFGLKGEKIDAATLDRRVQPSLAYDADQRELFAPLVDVAGIVGVFDEHGHIARTITIDANDRFIDVGPHSFLRVF